MTIDLPIPTEPAPLIPPPPLMPRLPPRLLTLPGLAAPRLDAHGAPVVADDAIDVDALDVLSVVRPHAQESDTRPERHDHAWAKEGS